MLAGSLGGITRCSGSRFSAILGRMRDWTILLGFIVVAGGWAMAGTGCGRSATAPQRDAAEPPDAPIAAGGALGTGGELGLGGATAADGAGSVASGGTGGTSAFGGAGGGTSSGAGGATGSGGSGTGGTASGGTGGTGGIVGSACNGIVESNLPGVSFVFSDGPCSYTLAEVAAGISIDYELRIEQALDGVHPVPLDMGFCDEPDPSGLITGYEISGGTSRYCFCDLGKCARRTFSTRTIPRAYHRTIQWYGRNWLGPSDTDTPQGDAFPPGIYTVTVTAEGTWDGEGSCDAGVCSADGGAGLAYQVTARRSITLTP
jgi:hypothetical protein